MSYKISILGNGAWGTAVAMVLCGNRHHVTIWGHNPHHVREVQRTRLNAVYLPGIRIPEGITLTHDLAEVADAQLIFGAVPTQHLRGVMEQFSAHHANVPVISLSKGLEISTFKRPSEIISDVLGNIPVGSLSGPSHAEEVAKSLPTTVVSASEDRELAQSVQAVLSSDRFRVYTNSDLLGVEIAGALKNVIAVSAGICDGLQFGDNTKAALLTRGLVEIARLGVALGAERDTFHGLAGIGDLITTCVSPFGRNRAVGEKIGRGYTLEEILAATAKVAEGVKTTQAVAPLARRMDIDMPITEEVYKILFEQKNPLVAVKELMLRGHKDELEQTD